MLNGKKAEIAAILSGIMFALASGAAGSITYTYPFPANCSAITIAPSGAISCSPGTPVRFTFAGPISCSGLAISASGAVSCALVPEGCMLGASSATPAPGDTITLTASGCKQSPASYSWTGSGIAVADSNTAQNTTSVTIPSSASAGPYPYSVIASNAAGAGTVAGTTVRVTVPGYMGLLPISRTTLLRAPCRCWIPQPTLSPRLCRFVPTPSVWQLIRREAGCMSRTPLTTPFR